MSMSGSPEYEELLERIEDMLQFILMRAERAGHSPSARAQGMDCRDYTFVKEET
jgi:hypothetical protein